MYAVQYYNGLLDSSTYGTSDLELESSLKDQREKGTEIYQLNTQNTSSVKRKLIILYAEKEVMVESFHDSEIFFQF